MEATKTGSTVLVLDAATLGRGDDDLGAQLIVNFLRTVAFRDEIPETVVCYNGGVKLAEQGSPGVADAGSAGSEGVGDPSLRHLCQLFPAC